MVFYISRDLAQISLRNISRKYTGVRNVRSLRACYVPPESRHEYGRKTGGKRNVSSCKHAEIYAATYIKSPRTATSSCAEFYLRPRGASSFSVAICIFETFSTERRSRDFPHSSRVKVDNHLELFGYRSQRRSISVKNWLKLTPSHIKGETAEGTDRTKSARDDNSTTLKCI